MGRARKGVGGATGSPITRGASTPYARGSHSQKKIKAAPMSVFGTKPKKSMPNIKARTEVYGRGV
jgi:hypothetical protein